MPGSHKTHSRFALSALLAALTATVCATAHAQQQSSLDDRKVDVALTNTNEIADARVAISLKQRSLSVLVGGDTLFTTTVAVASDEVLEYAGRRWQFSTPTGTRVVLSKKRDPVWLPPDWHYAEVAREHSLHVKTLPANGVTLSDGRLLTIQDSLVGIIMSEDSSFAALPVDEHIVFDSTIFIPPLATYNRQLSGELGKYALDLGSGYLLHGTRNAASIGTATTHGCIRLSDAALEWLFDHVPVGARVIVE